MSQEKKLNDNKSKLFSSRISEKKEKEDVSETLERIETFIIYNVEKEGLKYFSIALKQQTQSAISKIIRDIIDNCNSYFSQNDLSLHFISSGEYSLVEYNENEFGGLCESGNINDVFDRLNKMEKISHQKMLSCTNIRKFILLYNPQNLTKNFVKKDCSSLCFII